MGSVLAGVAHCIPGTGEYGSTSSHIGDRRYSVTQ